MARTTEPGFNVWLADALRRRHPRWAGALGSEQTGVLRARGRRPDIAIFDPRGLPVIVETEFEPARTVERDARGRLGEVLAHTGRPVEQAVALRIPAALRGDQAALAGRIEEAEFRYCVFSDGREGAARWPESGWVAGGIDDVATCIELASLSENRVIQGAGLLELGVGEAAHLFRERALAGHPDTLERIAAALHQQDGVQTSRMAMAIVANALCFHASIAGSHGIEPLEELHGELAGLLKTRLLACWRRILDEVNYWPIFAIASELLRPIPDATAQPILRRLERLANELAEIGATSMHDLSGRMFQRLIMDRKFLATFYTLPSSSALLAELAIARLDVDWSRADAVTNLRIADLACGTGALVGAAYRAVCARHRRAGGDDADIHGAMMERGLIAADIMPAATHLTAATLSSAHPDRTFADTQIFTMPYGEQSGGGRSIAIGSLDLIEDETTFPLFGTGRRRVRGAGREREDDAAVPRSLAHGAMDVVIMNPPFTRPTNHESTSVPVPSFAGFDTSRKEQQAMSKRLAQIRRARGTPASHGNAGLASSFVDLAHVKAAPGGIVALVLPASCLQGESWAGMRRLLADEYRDLLVVALAAAGSTERAFSADTGMAEVLIVAARRNGDEGGPPEAACFVNLHRRPRTLLEAVETARTIRDAAAGAEQGILAVGGEGRAGNFIRAPFHETGCAGLREPLLARTAMDLRAGRLRLPRMRESLPVPIARLADLGSRGAIDRDINGAEAGKDGLPRGPLDILAHDGARPATYPVLWKHDAGREAGMVVAPDSEGRARPGCDAKAVELWRRNAARLHFNRDFQLNSQPLAACLTPEPAIGGPAWPGFLPKDDAWEKPLLLWANTTLGLICFWWVGTRQQQGRARLTLSALPGLPALDPRALTARQIGQAEALFDSFRSRTLLPANEAYRDETRQALDRAVLLDWLGLPDDVIEPLALLRAQWCAEPGVHGGKATRPH